MPTADGRFKGIIDPWSGERMNGREAAESCRVKAREAEGFRPWLSRRWHKLRTGVDEPTPARLYERADWVEHMDLSTEDHKQPSGAEA